MTIDETVMETYDFGKRLIWPKPDLSSTFEAMRAYHDLLDSVKRLGEYAYINGRADHYVKNLDTLQFALRECLFKSMVIRESITGNKTKPLDC